MKKFIKIYLWIMLVILPITLISDILGKTSLAIVDYLDYAFWVIALLGVWGYCYEKEILVKNFWKLYLPSIVVWDLFVTYREFQLQLECPNLLLLCIGSVVVSIVLLPEYIALYFYGYRDNKTTPDQTNDPTSTNATSMQRRGKPCATCGSLETSNISKPRSRPNILYVMLFGWIVLLIRKAFTKDSCRCANCGEIRRYKSMGSWIALGVIVLLILLIALGFIVADY